MAKQLRRGAVPSPRSVLAAAFPHLAAPSPSQFARLAKKLLDWGNFDHGDCVTAEEASAKAIDVVIDDATIIAWAKKHGVLEGAMLTDVLDAMVTDGFVFDGTTYDDGNKQSVNWTDFDSVSSAIYQGQVKIAVAADQLQTAVGNDPKNGWMLLDAKTDQNYDHCVGLAGYGSLSYCAGQLGVPTPYGVDPSTLCEILFTWGTYGVISHASMIAITCEAWVRSPTTVIPEPPGPTPPTPPGPPNMSVIAIIKQAFAALEATIRNPTVLRVVIQTQKWIVAWLQAHGYSSYFGSKVPPWVMMMIVAMLRGAETLPQVQPYQAEIELAISLIQKLLG